MSNEEKETCMNRFTVTNPPSKPSDCINLDGMQCVKFWICPYAALAAGEIKL